MDSRIDTKYLIIGNGIAGLSAAQEIYKRDEQGKVTIVSSEEYLTYYRVKLSHYISKNFDNNELMVKKEGWYKDKNIDIILGSIVENIDTDNNVVKLDDGRELRYEKLLLANGSRPFVPPVAGKYKKGVLALRTLKDLRYIKNYFEDCNSVTVIGGGLLGLEAAWAIKELGKKVNVVEFFPYLLPRQLDEELSNKFKYILEKKGLDFYLGAAAEEVLGEEKVEGLKIKDGPEIKTDAILFSAGIRSNIGIAEKTKIDVGRGIKVDNYLRTNIDNVFAAGDIAEVNSVTLGLWTAANEQGKIAGINMTGGSKEYKLPEPYTMLNIADTSLFSVGDVKDFDDVVEFNDDENAVYHKLFLRDKKIIGAALIGDISKMVKVKNAVNNNLDISQDLENGLGFKDIVGKF
ncbi:NAD(P)/FAD-dependent oxidoreductase [Clostridiisalibacter paucivorans]|uniref:NAD(P)/FAD-dependent oxidoreductase n=1 Tax=Clostridiisalibacter paucivorans TaxID=408753 RepID=UPI00047BF6E5|nr:FAD-dependent oxidoreductase [Clostridiisalibacter paucivorans]